MRPAKPKRGRPKGSGKKVKVLFTIDKSIYKKLKKMKNMSGYVNSVLRIALSDVGMGEAGGSIPPGSTYTTPIIFPKETNTVASPSKTFMLSFPTVLLSSLIIPKLSLTTT